MVGCLVNNKLEETVNSEILFWHSPEDTEKTSAHLSYGNQPKFS
jgi:hypothetical protein